MSIPRFATLCLNVLVLLAVPTLAPASTDPLDLAPPRLSVADVAGPVVPVAAWDPASPQRLVRIEGELFQEDAGFFYRVATDSISVRLADGVKDWTSLVERATADAPQTFALLAELSVVRANRLGILDLRVPQGDVAAWAELVHRTDLVRYAEVSTLGVYLVASTDPRYAEQWALHNTGQTGGTPGADVHAEQAWDISSGNPAVIVGILDSGTNIDHPDLSANVWINLDEISGNAFDDDGNGYIDDRQGWDFGNNNNDPRSNNFHGSHVAGIIIAPGGNGIGIAGLAGGIGGPGARGMTLGVGESAPDAAVLDDAILYAADNGAQVITMSLSIGASSAVNDALSYAYNTKDVFIDCAAGNNGSSVGYPAVRPEVMAVASTTDDDTRSSFSNPGPEVEISAPGSNILSTQLGTSYGTSSGTSFAAPYAAAVAALIRGINPGLSAPQVRQLIIDTADDIEVPGFDTGTGFGRFNAFAALSEAGARDGVIRLDATQYACDSNLTVTVSDLDLAGAGTLPIVVRSGIEPGGESLILAETGTNSAAFTGSLPTSNGTVLLDGALQTFHADTLIAEYLDADDGRGGTDVLKLAQASTDCNGPLLDPPQAVAVDDGSAEIEWSTDESSSSIVRFGDSLPLSGQVSDPAPTTEHLVQLDGLQPCSVYKYEIESVDGLGNAAVDDNGGLYYTFETLGTTPGGGLSPCHRGRAHLDRTEYACSDVVAISLTDVDLGIDPAAVETVQVLMTSTSEPQGEWVTLSEDGSDSNRFDGTIVVDAPAAPGDGRLAVAPGDLISVSYFDEDDGDGLPNIDTALAVTDCAAPVLREIRLATVSASRAEVIWTTDEPATSRVEYGPTPALGSVAGSDELVLGHVVPVSAFGACDRVYFRVSSADAYGHERAVDAGGTPFEFNLRRVGGLLFHDNFETAAGWLLSGEWQRAAPQSLGSGGADPAGGFSGVSIIGNDLTGIGAYPGDYEPNAKQRAGTPVLDGSAASDLELILRRKLGVDNGDKASISLFTSSESAIWSALGPIDDGAWTEVRYDLGAADGVAGFRLFFTVESTNPGQSYGWNIDELIIKDATQPDYHVCGGCAGAPTFAGLKSAVDLDRCAATGIALAWDLAPAWGTGGGGTFEIHRGTTPDFIPDAGNKIASGVTGTSFIDGGAPVDAEVWYAVRARNDEVCAGAGGLADQNLLRRSATDTVAWPAAGSTGSSLRVGLVGRAHVRLTWDPATDAESYEVRRSTSADFSSPAVVGTTTGTLLEDVNAALLDELLTYAVVSVGACNQITP